MTTTTDEMLYAQPASVHFGGFELDRSVQQRVRVHNNSAKAVRLRYTFPAGKKGFRATFASAERPSFVSAGLSEEILVSFTPPSGFQYYYDCIQVQCEEVAYGSSVEVARSGATLIPLHAYPMVNEVAFPTRMDFGVVQRGTCARKYVDITCSVPVEFEYELRVTKPHPAFTVFPLTGTIPPRGEARIELEFRPLVYATASAELELQVSQLGFVARVCTLTGSSSSTAVGSPSAVEVAERQFVSTASPSSEEKARYRSEKQTKTSPASTPRGGTKTRSKQYVQEEPQADDVSFQQELREVAEAEKALEFQSHKVHLGQRLLSLAQIAQLTKEREVDSQTLGFQQRGQLRNVLVNVCYDPSTVANNQHQKSSDAQPLLLGELRTAVLPAHFEPTYMPDFKPYKNDMWARRQRVLRRLIRAVSTCILRLRAQKRLHRIRTWLGGAKTRPQVREKVALDWQLSAQSSGGVIDGGLRSNASMMDNPEQENLASNGAKPRYYLSSFPLVEENAAQKRRAGIDLPADWELKFNTFTFLELKPRDEVLLMGHENLPLPALPTYVPLEQGRVLRRGAGDECGVVNSLQVRPADLLSAKGSNSEYSQAIGMSLLEMMPLDAFLRPQASVRPLMDVQGPRETEPSYTLRPRRVFRIPASSFSSWQSSQIGLQSLQSSQNGSSLYLSDVLNNAADRKHVEAIFPCPTNAESGQSLYGDVWNVMSKAIPLLAKSAEDIPNLSDSESDDDGDTGSGSAASTSQISWKRALELFEDPLGELADAKDGSSSDTCEGGELLGYEKGVYSFERYRQLIRQEREHNSHRQELLERLPKVREKPSYWSDAGI
jgi:hypothetical protein